MEGLHTLLQEHRQAIGWITTISGVVFVGSLLLVPWIVVRIPEDYLIRDNTKERSSSPDRSSPTIQSWLLVIVRNGAGALLVFAGCAMLLLPGQGLLTIAVGLLLLDLPGKHHLVTRILGTKPVLKSVNWLRRKANVPPLTVER